ncbi:heparan-alpha-glucosaminide N-acetyltransferase domain-containing protein [Aliisedimentitalea scapharcae]|uniref:Heparan-alpha-glucosaminide N-acetyltransferase domain-containing protein n=1 Tax=Aliisedimentitalea scapharcae TaxID=1524259 RepID=A0ABZ2XZQ4_9RHOB
MRLSGLDIARFLAFCGMVLVNFRIAANVTPQDDLFSTLTTMLEGRAAALFVILAGIGLTLARSDTATVLRRAAFLFVIGLANLTIFDADILHFYAVYFVVALPFVPMNNRNLWISIAAILFVSVLALVILDYEAGWNWDTYSYSDFWTVTGFLRHTFFNGWHPVFPWICFLLVGLGIGRLQLGTRATQMRLIAGGTLVAVLGLIPGWITSDPELIDVLNATAIPPGPFYILSASGSAAAMIGLTLWAAPLLDWLGIAGWMTTPGRQALTLYVLHILVGMGILEALGLLDGSLETKAIFAYSLLFCALCAVYARIWTLLASRGPLETLMRKLAG